MARGDEVGLFWNEPPRQRAVRGEAGPRAMPPAPDTGWVLPEGVDAFPNLEGQGMIAIDVETKDPDLMERGPGAQRDGYIAGLSIGTEAGFRQYYPIAHEGGPNMEREHVLGWANEQLSRANQPKVGAKLLYDLEFLSVAGVKVVGPFYDVQIAEPLLDETRMSYNLESIARTHLEEGKKEDEMRDWLTSAFGERNFKSNIWRAPPAVVGPYAESDVDLPLRIFAKQKLALEKENLWELFDLESRVIPMLLAMRLRGVPVNLDAAEKLKSGMAARRDSALEEVKRLCGIRPDIWAADSIAAVFDKVGVEYPRTEKTKAPSFRKEWFEHHPHPITKLILEARRLDKYENTFLEGYILGGHNKGRLYAEFNQLRSDEGGTVSGRFSSSHPNLQNIPIRDKEFGKPIRNIFVPEQGEQWWKFDWCVAPGTRILTTDLEHIRADQVKPGMELIGFDESATSKVGSGRGSANMHRRKLRKTKVLYTKTLRQPCYEVVTNKGGFIASSAHKWLAKDGYSSTYSWRRTDSLKVGSLIPRLCDVWDKEDTHVGGWMAGILDGEGWYADSVLGVGQNEGPILKGIREWFQGHGYEWKEEINDSPNTFKPNTTKFVTHLRVVGGRNAFWKLMGSTRPTRLLQKVKDKGIEGKTFQTQSALPDHVVSIRYLGERDVIAIQTEHNTLIANGLASHNSQIEYRLIVHYAARLKLPGAADVVERYITDSSVDYHQIVAELTKLPRSSAKALNFGLAYGQGVELLCQNLGVPRDEGEAIIAEYHKRAPFIRPLANRASDTARGEGEIFTLLKRKRRFKAWEKDGIVKQEQFPGARRAFTHKALNALIQGSAADIMKKAMVQVWEDGCCNELGAPYLTVHDELDGSLPDSDAAREALAHVKDIMENCVKLSVPLKADGGVGPSWGDIA